jgi:hypothetical protein
MPRPTARAGSTSSGLIPALALLAVAGAMLLPGLARVREMARRGQCSRAAAGVVAAQNAYAVERRAADAQPAYVTGAEDFCRPAGDKVPEHAAESADGSRALTALLKRKLLAGSDAVLCPSDPFAAPPFGDGPVPDDVFDLPAEVGRTVLSYSLQGNGPGLRDGGWPAFRLNPGMSVRVPLVGDRNPWCEPVRSLGGDPFAAGMYPEANSWNHNREGQNLGFRDGRVLFVTDGRFLEVPDPAGSGRAVYDHPYRGASADSGLNPAAKAVPGRCSRPGTAVRLHPLPNVWLTE